MRSNPILASRLTGSPFTERCFVSLAIFHGTERVDVAVSIECSQSLNRCLPIKPRDRAVVVVKEQELTELPLQFLGRRAHDRAFRNPAEPELRRDAEEGVT